ncbi:MAG: LicD family protein, partial [Methanobrevibacter sp.]|nr:LicD family protein [Methanobrevibacter sp.]
NKLPKKIQNSESFLLYMMRFAKFIHKSSSKPSEPNHVLNFLFKNTDIKVEGTLRDIQLLSLELMRFIDNVCKKHDLDYFLIYGTLLGAVRHDGFIPWDDDFDIMMMREEYNKFMEILPQEINKHDYFKQNCGLTRLNSIEENYYKDFKSVYDKKLGHDEFFSQPKLGKSKFLQICWLKPLVKLDIFPFDYIKEESVEYYNKNYLGHKYYFRQLYDKKGFSFDKEFNERYEKLGCTLHNTKFIGEGIDGTYFDDFGVMETNLYFPIKTISFEGYDFNCPNKPHELLKLWYGEDYLDIPSNFRVHFYPEYNLSLFESKEEMKKSFDNAINYLKDLNDNFE